MPTDNRAEDINQYSSASSNPMKGRMRINLKNKLKEDFLMRNILIVDDSPAMQMNLTSIVKRIEECKTHSALDFVRAMQILKTHRMDILISDIFLNNESGIDIIREIRAGRTLAKRDIPIIAVSGESTVDVVLKTQLMDCNFFLTKPVSIDALKKKLSLSTHAAIDLKDSSFYDSIKAHIDEYNMQLVFSELNDNNSKDVMVIYTSKATDHLDKSDIESIIEISNENNKKHGITGALFFKDGYFLQFLEGPLHAIKDRLSIICNDTRHSDISIIMMTNIKGRMFKHWSMGYALFKNEETSNEVEFNQNETSHPMFEHFNKKKAVHLINSFSAGDWIIS